MYYMTIERLKALMPLIFTSNELLSISWADYTNEDLNAILGRSEDFLDTLRYKGCFVEDYQTHAFPRKLDTGYVVEIDDERVEKALCCIVYDTIKYIKSGSAKADRIRQGVKSISTGGVSESYGTLNEVQEISKNYAKYLGFCLFKGVI